MHTTRLIYSTSVCLHGLIILKYMSWGASIGTRARKSRPFTAMLNFVVVHLCLFAVKCHEIFHTDRYCLNLDWRDLDFSKYETLGRIFEEEISVWICLCCASVVLWNMIKLSSLHSRLSECLYVCKISEHLTAIWQRYTTTKFNIVVNGRLFRARVPIEAPSQIACMHWANVGVRAARSQLFSAVGPTLEQLQNKWNSAVNLRINSMIFSNVGGTLDMTIAYSAILWFSVINTVDQFVRIMWEFYVIYLHYILVSYNHFRPKQFLQCYFSLKCTLSAERLFSARILSRQKKRLSVNTTRQQSSFLTSKWENTGMVLFVP